MNPALDIANYLESQGIGTVGTNIFVGPVRPASQYVPINSIFVLGTGGYPPQRVLQTSTELKRPSVQVRVRWSSYEDGQAKAEAVYDTLESAGISGYLDVVADQSSPIPLGLDENNNYEWSLNFTLTYQT